MPLPEPMEQNKSIFNPADMAAMKQSGQFSQNMTVRQAMEKLGIDVDGPVAQLTEFAKKQVENANPLNKMKNIAQGGGAPPPGGPPPGDLGGNPPPTPPPAQGQGLEGLLRR